MTVATVKSSNILVMQHGIEAGLFAKQGLQVQQSALNNGPAVAVRHGSGSFDLGFAAVTALLSAAANEPDRSRSSRR